ncbi:MAG: glutathione S-transferase [Verrucomicrobia bacterium]|nr:glutathione S-transferase [Verrucomicrobiota bacterium]
MMTLIQMPFSPFCISVRRMLDWAGAKYREVNVSYCDRRAVVKATRGAYYQVPVLVDGKRIVWDKTDLGQEVARYVDAKFKLGCFPPGLDGLQRIVAQHIENDVEGPAFRVNDVFMLPTLPLYERTMATRHKERKFGKGCVESWRSHLDWWQQQFHDALLPYEAMLGHTKFLLGARPHFTDFDLYGVIAFYLFTGRPKLPGDLGKLKRWFGAMQ